MEEKVIPSRNHNVGNVFEDGHHWNRVVLQRGNARKEHETEKYVHGRPIAGRFQGQGRIFDPFHAFTKVDAQNRNNSLKDDNENIQSPVNQMIVT
jgi:hypothetical protein